MKIRCFFVVSILFLPTFVIADDFVPVNPRNIPTWPIAGSDADVAIEQGRQSYDGNIRVVSSIGQDLSVQNNIAVSGDAVFSGGADLTQPYQAPAGFDPYESQAMMPFMHSEMPDDDGAAVLSVSKSDRKPVVGPRDFPSVMGTVVRDDRELKDFEVEQQDKIAPEEKDDVRSWIVSSGEDLHSILGEWCNKEGWDLIWNTSREYPIAASAVFKGRFIDVASALVRNFSRATPVPYAKFYKGNRVLVISTKEDN